MPSLHFTPRGIAALTPPTTGTVDYWDLDAPGFGVRVGPATTKRPRGSRTWMVYYRAGSQKRRLKLGTFPAVTLAKARERARHARARVELGGDPAGDKYAERERQKDTIAGLVEHYTQHTAATKSAGEKARILRADVLPAWEHRAVSDITRRDVRELVETKAKTAPIAANRLLAQLSAMFNYGVDREWLEHNPAARIAPPSDEITRDRVLTRDELRALWAVLTPADEGNPELSSDTIIRLPDTEAAAKRPRSLSEPMKDAFLTLVLTAQRLGEVTRMQWADVSLEQGWWTIPASDAKNADPHRVPLTAPVLAILERRRAAAHVDARYVFSKKRGAHMYRRSKGAAAMLSASLPFAFRAHDLRRTAASYMAEAGIPRDHIAHVLNHRSVTKNTVTAVYDRHTYFAEKKLALDTWARTLDGIIHNRKAGAAVVPMTRTVASLASMNSSS